MTVNVVQSRDNSRELAAILALVNQLVADGIVNRATTGPALADGTTDGKLQNGADVSYQIAGQLYVKDATDDLWDLSGVTDTGSGEYQAHDLYLDAAGTATIGSGTVAASAALALAALPAIPATKAVIGVYVAGPSTDYNGAAGLTAQGTLTQGLDSARAHTAEAITFIGP